MEELAKMLSSAIDKMMDANFAQADSWQRNKARCSMQCIAQKAIGHQYGIDGEILFVRIEDEKYDREMEREYRATRRLLNHSVFAD